jgi:hypothetical protein
MTFFSLALSGRYDADGRRLGFQIRPSAKQYMRVALKSETANRRACALQDRLIEKAAASGLRSTRSVDPLERAAMVKRLRKPEMTDDEIDALVRFVEAYLSGRLCAADGRLWLCRFMEADSLSDQERPYIVVTA